MSEETGSKRGLYVGLGLAGCFALLFCGGIVGIAVMVQFGPSESSCSTQLRIDGLLVPDGCWVDISDHRTAVLEWDCSSGAATATFGTHAFAGTVQDGLVELVSSTEFDWSDGCRWETRQTIGGVLGGPLGFSYLEGPLAGQRGCSNSCAATGVVIAQGDY